MRSRVLSSRLRERVVVTTKSGHGFAGVLYSFDNKALVLVDCVALGVAEDRSDVEIDGQQIVLFDNVDYIQKP